MGRRDVSLQPSAHRAQECQWGFWGRGRGEAEGAQQGVALTPQLREGRPGAEGHAPCFKVRLDGQLSTNTSRDGFLHDRWALGVAWRRPDETASPGRHPAG